jgi:uncharacterized protein YcbK (DUF882 family)
MDDKISKSFRWSEFTKSDTASRLHIVNTINDWDVRDNIKALVENVLQPLRDAWGGPIFINSGYRSKELNEAVGGVETSQHRTGCASDCGVTDPYSLAKLLLHMKLDFDQAIIYPSFLHISYKRDGENRRQLLYSKNYKGPKDLK